VNGAPTGAVDTWTPVEGVYAPPILVGAPSVGIADATTPQTGDDERWYRLDRLSDLATGQLDRLIEDVTRTRGYLDGQARGGGLALLTSGIGSGAAFRAIDGVPVPVLHPARTWVAITEYGNAKAMRVEDVEFVEEITAVRMMLRNALDPFYDAIRQRTRFPVVAQWAQFESTIAYALFETAEDHTDARRRLEAIFADGDVLERGLPQIRVLTHEGREVAYATRRVCCYNFRGRHGEYCGSQCPLVPVEERDRDALERR
jgi:hypothetical protein